MKDIHRPRSSRQKAEKAGSAQRLDIQGLRTVAVMLVVLDHLLGWPRGGFIGVDVFFVISGFLITGSLLHTLEKTGRISFSSFYRRRIRRIVPAATLVLVLTCITGYFVYSSSRLSSVLLDSVAAFLFVSNWRFGIEGTDYFTESGPVSPLQHYWSLSVEEQFYFVWPAVIFLIGVVAARKAWVSSRRTVMAAGAMGVIVVTSFAYSVIDTASNPTWAYFSTLTRVWELGIGALIAICIRNFERIPDAARPFIAWAGIIVIAVGAFLISENGGGFPAPWAVIPVVGAALVIIAGVSGEQKYLSVLTNRVSTYIGDISYSLYLWHWPVIILLSSLMEPTLYYYVTCLFIMFGGAIAAYHFFENPIRASKWLETDSEVRDRNALDFSRWRLRTLKMSETSQSIGIGALALVTAGIATFALSPIQPPAAAPIRTAVIASTSDQSETDQFPLGDAGVSLANQIDEAVAATDWPELSPSMDDAIKGPQTPSYISPCGQVERPAVENCTWGEQSAPKTIMVLGDSVAMTYIEPLKYFAENSAGEWKVSNEAMFGCTFLDIAMRDEGDKFGAACPDRKVAAIRAVNELRP